MKKNVKLMFISTAKMIAFFVIVTVVFWGFVHISKNLELFFNRFSAFFFIMFVAVTVWCLLAKSLKEYWWKLLGYLLAYFLLVLLFMMPEENIFLMIMVVFIAVIAGESANGDPEAFVNGGVEVFVNFLLAVGFMIMLVVLVIVVMFFVALIRNRISKRKKHSEEVNVLE